MSNAYIDIRVFDYATRETLSAYALSATPLTFVPEFTLLTESNNVIWDFGDGTFSTDTSASKYYSFPGEYDVKLVVFDCDNNAITSTIQKTIIIYDFLPLTFGVGGTASLSSICGRTSDAFYLNVSYPYYQSPISLYYSVSGSNSNNYWGVENLKYSHLENTYGLYELYYNNHIGSYQYRPIDKITPTVKNIYAKIDNDNIILCDAGDAGSFFVGLSGGSIFFYKDDLPSDNILITLKFDKTKYQLPLNSEYVQYMNNFGVTIPFKVYDNSPSHLSITSNGIDGEYFTIGSFDISKIKFFNTKIPFIIKVKDEYNFSYKNLRSISLSDVGITVYSDSQVLPLSYYTVSSLNYTLSDQNMNGAFRGYIKFTENTFSLKNVKLSATAILTPILSVVEGESSVFSVYPKNYYDVYKKNENFNASQTLKDLVFQDILMDNNILFNDFFGGVFGDENTDHAGIYLKIYEKISNFVANTQDLDESEIDFLNSLSKFLNYNDVNEEVYEYPDKIKRLIDLLSISRHRLFGTYNKFNDNLNPKGDTQKIKFGINTGKQIDTNTYTLTAGKDIVALEKFSNEYIRLNSYQPISAVGSHTYMLSSYTDDWGWPLVLPQSFNVDDFDKYYIFFEFNELYDNTLLGGVIDFNNPNTNISYTEMGDSMFYDGGLTDILFLDTLYQSLSLV